MIETSSDESFHKMEGKDKGFIYVIYNDMFGFYGNNVYKVGKTQDLTTRTRQYKTYYLKPSELRYGSQLCINSQLAERLVFMKLQDYRIKPNREFFNVELSKAIEIIDEIVEYVNSKTDDAHSKLSEYVSEKSRIHRRTDDNKQAQKIRAKTHYELNKEAICEYKKLYNEPYETYKDNLRDFMRKYRKDHRERIQEQARLRYKRKKDEFLATL